MCPLRHVSPLNDLDDDEEGLVVMGADRSLTHVLGSRQSHVHTYHVELRHNMDEDAV